MTNEQNVLDLKRAPAPEDPEEEERPLPPERGGDSFWDLLKFGIFALLIVIPIRLFIAQPFIVSGTSMVPTFHDSEYLIVDEISYRLSDPKRGDVIIFKAPTNTSKYYIKRVIGLPGETVEIKGSTVTVANEAHPDGLLLDEPYVEHPSYNDLRIVLKDGEYFVMGDNRIASSDSRAWGPLPERLIVGRALLRLFPLGSAAVMPGDFDQPN